jgi:hypothetical protein
MQLRELGSLPPGVAILRDGSMDRPHQICLFERFGEEVNRACLYGTHGRGNVTVSCDKYDLREISLPNLTLEIQSIDVRKFHIQNQASWNVWLRIRDVLSSGTERDHLQIEGRKKLR